MASVQIRNLAKRFDGADGEFLVLVGASGCGKSTLLRMIAGLEPITSGEIAIGGRRVNELEPRDRDVAMVFQSYALYPHLDVKLRVAMRTEIRALHQRLHATSIYVTHDQVEAMTMADRMVVMNAGRIEQIGPPLDVYDRPQTLYVAQFIGSPAINAWRGVLEIDDRDRAQVRTDAGITLALSAATAPAGSSIAIAFRPEHVVVDPEGPLDGHVDVVETLGPETYVYLDVAGVRMCARVDRSRRMTPGDRVRMHVPEQAIHVFDAANGRRLGA